MHVVTAYRQVRVYEEMQAALYRAESLSLVPAVRMLRSWTHSEARQGVGDLLVLAAAVQGRHDRISRAARREFAILTWGREVAL